MVVFTCNHCGDSLQKPRVQKHYDTTCRRNPKSLTCVDCLKDFKLEDYAAHTKCVTETERYAAKGTVLGAPKGEKKQETWVEQVQSFIEEQKTTVNSNIKIVFELILNYPNIPKKRKPFINFLTSASGGKINLKHITDAWTVLETEILQKTKLQAQNGTNKNQEGSEKTAENGAEVSAETNDKKKKNKKSKQNDSIETTETSTNSKKKRKLEDGETVENGAEVSAETIGKVKKNKKSKQNGSTETTEPPVETSEISSKSKKKRKLEDGETVENGAETNGKVKKNKKSKQNGSAETTDEPLVETSEASTDSKKKRKLKDGETVADQDVPKKKKKSVEEIKTITDAEETFPWTEIIPELLTEHPEGILKEELKNTAFSKYEAINGPIENKKLLTKRFNKILYNMKNVFNKNGLVNLHASGEEYYPNFNWAEEIPELLKEHPEGVHKKELKTKVLTRYEEKIGPIEHKKHFLKELKQNVYQMTNVFNENGVYKLRAATAEDVPKKRNTVRDKNSPRFLWQEVIPELLKEHPEGVQTEQLREKVLEKFIAQMGPLERTRNFAKKFLRSIKAMTNVQCENNLVKLI